MLTFNSKMYGNTVNFSVEHNSRTRLCHNRNVFVKEQKLIPFFPHDFRKIPLNKHKQQQQNGYRKTLPFKGNDNSFYILSVIFICINKHNKLKE